MLQLNTVDMSSIERHVEAALTAWDADGWILIGPSDRMRVAVFAVGVYVLLFDFN